jgi:AraC-like DNA-binding protein
MAYWEEGGRARTIAMDEDRPGWVRFSTDALPERDRFPMYCEEVIRRIVAVDIAKREGTRFGGSIDICHAGAVEITRLTSSPASYSRTPGLVRDGRDTLFAILCLEGSVRSTQGPLEHRVEPGDGVLCDSTEIGGIAAAADTRFWALQIPRAKIERLVPHVDRLAGIRLTNNGLAMRLLSGYLDELLAHDLTRDEHAARIFGDHVIDLVALALGAQGEAREQVEHRGARGARRTAILREIDHRIGDPALNVAALAAQLAITPRYVHRLLEETGMTFSEYVLVKRLDRAVQLLSDRGRDNLTIADIAEKSGFTDLSHFNRSFRRRYGDTPSSVRTRTAQRAGSSPRG